MSLLSCPLEILQRILSNLSFNEQVRCRRVCRVLKRAAENVLRPTLAVRLDPQNMPIYWDEVTSSLFPQIPIRRIVTREGEGVFWFLRRYCPKLRSVEALSLETAIPFEFIYRFRRKLLYFSTKCIDPQFFSRDFLLGLDTPTSFPALVAFTIESWVNYYINWPHPNEFYQIRKANCRDGNHFYSWSVTRCQPSRPVVVPFDIRILTIELSVFHMVPFEVAKSLLSLELNCNSNVETADMDKMKLIVKEAGKLTSIKVKNHSMDSGHLLDFFPILNRKPQLRYFSLVDANFPDTFPHINPIAASIGPNLHYFRSDFGIPLRLSINNNQLKILKIRSTELTTLDFDFPLLLQLDLEIDCVKYELMKVFLKLLATLKNLEYISLKFPQVDGCRGPKLTFDLYQSTFPSTRKFFWEVKDVALKLHMWNGPVYFNYRDRVVSFSDSVFSEKFHLRVHTGRADSFTLNFVERNLSIEKIIIDSVKGRSKLSRIEKIIANCPYIKYCDLLEDVDDKLLGKFALILGQLMFLRGIKAQTLNCDSLLRMVKCYRKKLIAEHQIQLLNEQIRRSLSVWDGETLPNSRFNG